MLESIEKHSANTPKEESPKISSEIPEWKKRRISKLVKEIENTPVENYQKIIELTEEIKAVYEKKIIGWHKEGKLGEKDIIAEYQAEGVVKAANFSPEGNKVVIGTGDGKIIVIG
ncbi:MAG: hypothetical protein QW609_04490 [Candidatus Aenigmatarchaeota archaeon]